VTESVAGHNFDIFRFARRHKFDKKFLGTLLLLRLLAAELSMRPTSGVQMDRLLKTGVVGVLMACALTGCSDTYDPGQRAVGGALIGAGSGAAIGAIAGGPAGAAIGAGVGAVAGAATGYATTPPPPPRQQPYYPPPSGY
jgi:hypothetical protein